jgi:hypothetical protein
LQLKAGAFARRLPAHRPAGTLLIILVSLSQGSWAGADDTPPGGVLTTRASTEVSAYSDTDAVHVLSPTIAGSIADPVAGWSVSGRYLVDAVSAASVDIVSTASRHWFEVRHVGSLSADVKAGPAGLSLAGGLSREPDYLSVGGGGTVSLEMLDKNLTPFVAVSYGHDDVGRTGMPKSLWKTMQKGTVQLGATFVVDQATIASLSVDAIFERGYLAKPYRYVPLFAPGVPAQVPPGASIDLVNEKRLPLRPADALPDARDRFALSGRIAHRFDGSTLRLDQRVYHDSWGAWASTTDGRFIIDAGQRLRLWPHARFHIQTGIDLWQRAYLAPAANGIPIYRTGDRELGPLHTTTAGVGARLLLTADARASWALTAEAQAMFTRFLDALYTTQRRALFANLALEAVFD